MEALSFAQALERFSKIVETTNSERTQFLVRHECGDVVVMSKAEYDSIQEMLYLHASAKTRDVSAGQLPSLRQIQARKRSLPDSLGKSQKRGCCWALSLCRYFTEPYQSESCV